MNGTGMLASRGRALLALVASGLAIVGFVVLVGGWLRVDVDTTRASQDGPACVRAVGQDGSDAAVSYRVFPARSTCTWTVDGEQQETVVTAVSVPLASAALGGAALGVGTVVVMAVVARRRTGRAEGVSSGA
ncbi:hypothetical protein [Cellulomonas hominis]